MLANSLIPENINKRVMKMKRDIWEAEHLCQNDNHKMNKTNVVIEGMSVRAWECPKCKETVLHPEDAQKMLVFNKLRHGIPVKVGKLGEALMVRIPKEFAQFYSIQKGGGLILKGEDESRFEVKVA